MLQFRFYFETFTPAQILREISMAARSPSERLIQPRMPREFSKNSDNIIKNLNWDGKIYAGFRVTS